MPPAHAPVADPTETWTDLEKSSSGHGNDESGIRCPLCKWRPRAHDRWACKCGYIWNTFDTGGVCPGCLYQWKITACLSCHQYSAHSDWYGDS
jgi:hypothetical protein